jgi:hypothetical protein
MTTTTKENTPIGTLSEARCGDRFTRAWIDQQCHEVRRTQSTPYVLLPGRSLLTTRGLLHGPAPLRAVGDVSPSRLSELVALGAVSALADPEGPKAA